MRRTSSSAALVTSLRSPSRRAVGHAEGDGDVLDRPPRISRMFCPNVLDLIQAISERSLRPPAGPAGACRRW